MCFSHFLGVGHSWVDGYWLVDEIIVGSLGFSHEWEDVFSREREGKGKLAGIKSGY